jgi:hypothetical protein
LNEKDNRNFHRTVIGAKLKESARGLWIKCFDDQKIMRSSTMKTIKLDFVDFWPGFDKTNNYFYNLLKTRYEIGISSKPDFLIYSVFGKGYKKYKCTRIFYTGENVRPNFNECDFAFTFDHIENNPRHYRLPLYALYLKNSPKILIKGENYKPEDLLKEKTDFCNFVYSNSKATKRVEFFHKLSKYKLVASGGKILNNVGGRVPDKLEFIRKFKFTIAFENYSYPGYTTEKLIQPMLMGSIPIYWGNPMVAKDFNPMSFINYNDYQDDEAVIERIIELDRNDDLYLKYCNEPYYHNNVVNEYIKPENVLKQFEMIFDSQIIPLAQQKGIWRFW